MGNSLPALVPLWNALNAQCIFITPIRWIPFSWPRNHADRNITESLAVHHPFNKQAGVSVSAMGERFGNCLQSSSQLGILSSSTTRSSSLLSSSASEGDCFSIGGRLLEFRREHCVRGSDLIFSKELCSGREYWRANIHISPLQQFISSSFVRSQLLPTDTKDLWIYLGSSTIYDPLGVRRCFA